MPGTTFVEFANDYRGAGYSGVLDAVAQGLKNQYHIVRAAVKQEAGANFSVADYYVGPVLEVPNPTTGKITAQWWRDLGINYFVKVDKIKPAVRTTGRKPSSNP